GRNATAVTSAAKARSPFARHTPILGRATGRGVMGNRRGSAGGRLSSRAIRMTVVTTIAGASGAAAQTSNTMSGPPVQVQPYAPEPGVPLITINPGTPNPFAGATDPTAAGGGSTDSGAGSGTAVAATGVSGG